jgi:hypothetical protein
MEWRFWSGELSDQADVCREEKSEGIRSLSREWQETGGVVEEGQELRMKI